VTLQIWIDEQIADRAVFARWGDVHPFSGRAIDAERLRRADVLIVRSVTCVDSDLLAGTPVRFVGSVTTGVDHVDVEYLRSIGITFATAAGFNAKPVAEYVLACLFLIASDRGLATDRLTLGVVGAGRIGRRLGQWAAQLGLRVLYNDPPLERAGRPGPWSSVDAILAESDVISLHTPLERGGPFPTMKLVGTDWLERMKRDATLINTSRGGVCDESSIIRAMEAGRAPHIILDTWENEPDIDTTLMRRCRLATPHIAGHSLEARRRGVAMIARSLAAWSDGGASAPGGDAECEPGVIPPEKSHGARELIARRVPSAAGALMTMDATFRAAMAADGEGFDAIRKALGGRREFLGDAD